MNYKRLLVLAEIGARQELEKALSDFQVLLIKSDIELAEMCDYDKAREAVDRATDEYKELAYLINALKSF